MTSPKSCDMRPFSIERGFAFALRAMVVSVAFAGFIWPSRVSALHLPGDPLVWLGLDPFESGWNYLLNWEDQFSPDVYPDEPIEIVGSYFIPPLGGYHSQLYVDKTHTIESLKFVNSALHDTSYTLVGPGELHIDYQGFIENSSGVSQTITNNMLLTGDIITNSPLTISGVISSQTPVASITKSGSSTLTLSGDNIFSGGIYVTEGTLKLGANEVLPDAGTVGVTGTGTLNVNNHFDTIGRLSVSGSGANIVAANDSLFLTSSGAYPIYLADGGDITDGDLYLSLIGSGDSGVGILVGGSGDTSVVNAPLNLGNVTREFTILDVNPTGDELIWNGVISGNGGIKKDYPGSMVLGAANTYGGPTIVDSGTLKLGASNVLPDTTDVAITFGGTLALNDKADTVNSLKISGTGTVTAAADTLFLASTGDALTIVDGAGISDGDAYLSLTGSSGGNIVVTNSSPFNGGSIMNGPLNLGNAQRTIQVEEISNSFDELTWNGTIFGSGGINKSGPGEMRLGGNNTYTGGTELSEGTLFVTSDSNLGNASGGLTFNGGTLGVSGTTFASTARSFSWQSGGGGFDIEDASHTFTVNQSLGGTGGLTKSGAGTLALSASNSYTGGTIVNEGRLTVNTNSLPGNVTNNSELAFNQSSSGTYANVISGTGSLIKSGAGNLTLTGNNSHTGGTTVSAGRLTVNTNSLPGNVTNNSELEFNQGSSGTYANVISGTGSLIKSGAGNLTLTGNNSHTGGTTVLGGRLTVNTNSLPGNVSNNSELEFNQGFSGTYADVISGSGLLIKSGVGNLTLTGTNSHTGGTVINDGRLTVNTNSLPGSVVNNSELEFNQGFTSSYADVISGTGSLIKSGAGNLTLTGNNSHTGGTVISGGRLTVDTNSFPGNVTNNNELEFNQSFTGTHAGAISGTGSLLKSGVGNLTLTGNNSHTGGTVISGGRLTVDTNSLPGDVTNNSELEFNQGSSGTYADVISGTGTLIKSGSGTLTLSGSSTYTGNTIIDGGRIRVSTLADAGLPSGIGAGSVVELNEIFAWLNYTGPSVEIDRDFVVGSSVYIQSGVGTLTLDGTISGSGSPQFVGTIVPTGTNTYTGSTGIQTQSTTIVDSISNSGVAGPLGAGSYIYMAPGASLVFTGASGATNRTISLSSGFSLDHTVDVTSGELALGGTISGGDSNHKIAKAGAGTLVFTGNNTYSENTVVAAGILQVNNSTGSGTGSGSVTVESGATLGGSGNIDGPVFAEAGSTVAPGTSPGELTVDSIDFESGSTLELEIDGIIAGTSFDVLTVDGAATLDGTLDATVGYAADYGASFQVMTFTSRTGVFSSVTDTGLAAGLVLAPFYSDTDLTLSVELAGDASGDGQVDIGDFTVWGDSFGMTGASYDNGDFSRDGHVDIGDFTVWGDHFGAMASLPSGNINAVPEPSSVVLAAVGFLALVGCGWRRRRGKK